MTLVVNALVRGLFGLAVGLLSYKVSPHFLAMSPESVIAFCTGFLATIWLPVHVEHANEKTKLPKELSSLTEE